MRRPKFKTPLTESILITEQVIAELKILHPDMGDIPELVTLKCGHEKPFLGSYLKKDYSDFQDLCSDCLLHAHNLQMSGYNKSLAQKDYEAALRTNRLYRLKNKEVLNKQKREKYANNPEYSEYYKRKNKENYEKNKEIIKAERRAKYAKKKEEWEIKQQIKENRLASERSERSQYSAGERRNERTENFLNTEFISEIKKCD